MVGKFAIAATPHIRFGSGIMKELPKFLEPFGSEVLLVTGSKSFVTSDHWDRLLLQFESAKIHWKHYVVSREPTPAIIDQCVEVHQNSRLDVVVAIGGGSVIDAGKAIAAMLCHEGSTMEYLEGVGSRQPGRAKIPFIAIPTTSGTGSEATKNAVVSEIGDSGYKKSLRHDNYVPDVALVDPELTLSCPPKVTAYSGMDAFTQLLESYLSSRANPMTDALAVDGIRMIRDGLEDAVLTGDDLKAREKMAYAAMISGITLANAGLGTVHGFASSIGGYFDIPHGLICAKMMLPVNQLTLEKLKQKAPNDRALSKYARIGKLFSEDKNRPDEEYIQLLMGIIKKYSDSFKLPGFGEFGVKKSDFPKIVKATGNKNNPVFLDDGDLEEALGMAL